MSNNSKKLKILHTSDWHLGRSLYENKRYAEFEKFLDWLAELMKTEKIGVLLVAGDVFDTTTPSNRAQELYYQFLTKASRSGCRHIVIIGGNHDSPTFLNAPRELLRFFNVYVVGSMTESTEEEVIVLHDNSEKPEAIICAVPYLRDRDVRTVAPGEKMEDKNRKLLEGIAAHYSEIGSFASEKKKMHREIPIIGMGHLFTSGGKATDGDGVRELYVGGAAQVNENSFPECFDYLALGHLHSAQIVGTSEHKRYSGSPIPMGFGEAGQEKKVTIIEFDQCVPLISEHTVPCFQELQLISGNKEEIISKIELLKFSGSSAWLEIDFTGSEFFTGISDLVNEAVTGSNLEILRIKNKIPALQTLAKMDEQETLDDLDPDEVFSRCLDASNVKEPTRTELLLAYQEITNNLFEQDINAE